MRTILTIAAILLLLAGGTFFLQGIGLLPGSYMTGQSTWAIVGGVMEVAGIVMLLQIRRRRHRP